MRSQSKSDRLRHAAAGLAAVLACAGWFIVATDRQRVLLFHSLWLGLEAAGCSLLIATPLAWFCARTDAPLRNVIWSVLSSLLFVPLYVQTAAWQSGIRGAGWFFAAGPAADSAWRQGWWVAVWVHAAAAVPWCAVILTYGWKWGWRESEEAAALELPPLGVVWHVSLPSLVPWLLVAATWTMLTAITELSVVDLFQVDTMSRELYTGFALGRHLSDALMALWVPWLLLACPAWWMLHYASTRPLPSAAHHTTTVKLGRWRWWAAGAASSWVISCVVVPFGNLLYDAGATQDQQKHWHWTLVSFARTMSAGWHEFQSEIYWTSIIALAAATGVTVTVWLAAWGAHCSRGLAHFGLAVAALLLALPGPLLGMLLLSVLSNPKWPWLYRLGDQTVLGPVLAASCRAWPLAYTLMWVAARRVDREQLDAAALQGASRTRQYWSILWPQCRVASGAVWLMTFATSTGELAATLLVIPPGVDTVATRIANLMHSGIYQKESVLCLWHLVFSMVLAWFVIHGIPRALRITPP